MPTQRNQLPKIELGKCPFCEKEIMTIDEKNNPVFQEGYSTFWVLLSDQSKMKVAICEDCKKDLDQKKVDALMTAHQEYWKQGIEELIDKQIEELQAKRTQNVNYYTNLSATKFALKERDLE